MNGGSTAPRKGRRMSKDQDNAPHGKMRPAPGAPPGIELDGKGNVIPLEQRTKGDQEKARAAAAQGSIKNPGQELEHPAPMPRAQQGQGGAPADQDPEGQQGSTKR